ncbi:MAG: F0F1 ATP synthase subunit C [Verrucomicrobiota bacterium]
MDSAQIIPMVTIITAAAATVIGCIAPAINQGRAISTALTAMAQQPDIAPTITRTLFVGLAMIESLAIYAFVVSMILIFANPFTHAAVTAGAGR